MLTMHRSFEDLRERYRFPSPTLVEQLMHTGEWDKLSTSPLKEVLEFHWAPYRLVLIFLFILHVLNMALVSLFVVLPLNEDDDTRGLYANPLVNNVHVWGSIWPASMLLLNIVVFILFVLSNTRGWPFDSITQLIENILLKAISITYCITWFMWVSSMFQDTSQQNIVFALSIVLGWMTSLQFLDAFKDVHHYSLILMRVLVQDMRKFAIVLGLLLIGYSFAIFVVSRNACEQEMLDSLGAAFLLTFRWAIGTADFFEIDRNLTLTAVCDRGTTWSLTEGYTLRILYTTYIIVLSVALLNMVMAILIRSHDLFELRQVNSWRYRSTKAALTIEWCAWELPRPLRILYFKMIRKIMTYRIVMLRELPEYSIEVDDERNLTYLKRQADKPHRYEDPDYGAESTPKPSFIWKSKHKYAAISEV